MKWLILLVAIITNASASVLIKYATMPPRRFPSLADPAAALGNWAFWLGFGMYGAAFLLYAAALARLPLNVAHPIVTSGAIVVSLSSILFLVNPFTGPSCPASCLS